MPPTPSARLCLLIFRPRSSSPITESLMHSWSWRISLSECSTIARPLRQGIWVFPVRFRSTARHRRPNRLHRPRRRQRIRLHLHREILRSLLLPEPPLLRKQLPRLHRLLLQVLLQPLLQPLLLRGLPLPTARRPDRPR